ncbi:MAG TPA: 3-isopropylmalate dehydratase large subunit, partial [Rhodobacteraceae bacterium]|nr:3-isopropylmalate dehydratase large subunit [Paracoccaceae bacterium]
QWVAAEVVWDALLTAEDAAFDTEIYIDAAHIEPTVTWGTSPEQALPISARLPDPAKLDAQKSELASEALEYMGLSKDQNLAGTPVDQVFIGSCTNGRIEDLRAAAAVLTGRRAKVPGLVSPGSQLIKAQAEQEGLDKVFTDAGLEWVASGCSMCVGMNGDLVDNKKRCASSTNRNFKGRQGRGARTHLMSPSMVAAAAVTGEITDVRTLLQDRNI